VRGYEPDFDQSTLDIATGISAEDPRWQRLQDRLGHPGGVSKRFDDDFSEARYRWRRRVFGTMER
jgi:hypothetical protein